MRPSVQICWRGSDSNRILGLVTMIIDIVKNTKKELTPVAAIGNDTVALLENDGTGTLAESRYFVAAGVAELINKGTRATSVGASAT